MRHLSIALILIVPSWASAQNCSTFRGNNCTPFVRHQETYVAPAAVVTTPVLAVEIPIPVFAFQVLTAYQPPTVVAPVAQQATFAAPIAQPVAAARTGLSDEEMSRIAEKVVALMGNGPRTNALPVAADDVPASQPGEGVQARAASFFGTNCKSCHGETNAKGDFRLFTGNTIDPRRASDGSPFPWATVLAKIDTEGGSHAPAMPPSAKADRSKWADPDVLAFTRSLAAQQQQPPR